MKIIVAFNPAFFKDEKRAIIQRNVFEVLSRLPKNMVPVAFGFEGDNDHPDVKKFGFRSLNILKKDAKAIVGNERKLPYIDEILNNCAQLDCDIIGYINSDILLTHKVNDALHEGCDAFIFSRFDIEEVSPMNFKKGKIKIIPGGDQHPGADGFFFNKEWWIKNHDSFTDKLIIGESEWDTCYRIVITHTTNKYLEKRCLYHVYHKDALWTTYGEGTKNNHKVYMGIMKRFNLDNERPIEKPNNRSIEKPNDTSQNTQEEQPFKPPKTPKPARKGFLGRGRWL